VPEVIPSQATAPDIIALEDVTKEYGTVVKTMALRGVTFKVEAKEFLAIIGQSGSGKSTLLNLLGLLDRPTSGRLTLLGVEVGELSDKERATFRNRHLGFVFQFHHLLPEFSVRENLLLPTLIDTKTKSMARSVSAAAGLTRSSTSWGWAD
jgi:lipoprotein-releasing system ATP-binding protein